MSEIINVDLYGGKGIFGGKEDPLVAHIIHCDKYEQCSYFKENQCLRVKSFLAPICKYGYSENIRGYTSRAKKYHEFKNKYKAHEKYGKLKYPPQKLGLIGEEVVFNYPHIRIKKDSYEITNPDFGDKLVYIPIEDFTIDLIKNICKFRPRAMMGGEIYTYQEEIVPLFLAHLKELLPNKYEELIKEEAFVIPAIKLVGRKAFLKTINPSNIYYQSKNYSELNEEWIWDGKTLSFKRGRVSHFNITNDYQIAEIKIIPSDKSVVTITEDKQVSDNTKFLD